MSLGNTALRPLRRVGLVVGYSASVDRDAVGQYSELLCKHMADRAGGSDGRDIEVELLAFRPSSWVEWLRTFPRHMKRYDLIHIQYPSEGWGRSPLPGIVPGLVRVLPGRKRALLVTTLHEWHSMHVLRKASVMPLALFSDAVVFASKREKDTFTSEMVYKLRCRKPVVRLIPPGANIRIPAIEDDAILQRRTELLAWGGVPADLLVGYFGFVYAWKQPEKMLEAIAHMHRHGIRARLVMAGDFLADHSRDREKFLQLVEELGLGDYVVALGFIEDEVELATVLKACNTVLLLFLDGVSSRRGSFWYVIELGVPIITTEPGYPGEFDGIVNLEGLKGLRFVSPAAAPSDIAAAIAEHRDYAVAQSREGISPSWDAMAEEHGALYGELL